MPRKKLPDVKVSGVEAEPPLISHTRVDEKATTPTNDAGSQQITERVASGGPSDYHNQEVLKTRTEADNSQDSTVSGDKRTQATTTRENDAEVVGQPFNWFGASSAVAITVAGIAALVSVATLVFTLYSRETTDNTPETQQLETPNPGQLISESAAVVHNVSLSIVIMDLGRVLLTSQPYSSEIRAVRALASDDEDIMTFVEFLEPYSVNGVPTEKELLEALPALEGEIHKFSPDDESWSTKALISVRSLVDSVLSENGSKPDRLKAIMSVTADQLKKGSLEGAILALAELDNPAQEMAARYVEKIKGRLALNRASVALTELALNRLATLEQ